MSTAIDKKDGALFGQNIKGMMMTLIEHWNAPMDDARAELSLPRYVRLTFGSLPSFAVERSNVLIFTARWASCGRQHSNRSKVWLPAI